MKLKEAIKLCASNCTIVVWDSDKEQETETLDASEWENKVRALDVYGENTVLSLRPCASFHESSSWDDGSLNVRINSTIKIYVYKNNDSPHWKLRYTTENDDVGYMFQDEDSEWWYENKFFATKEEAYEYKKNNLKRMNEWLEKVSK